LKDVNGVLLTGKLGKLCTFKVDQNRLSCLPSHIGKWVIFCCIIHRDHSFPRQIFPNSAGQFAKFRDSPQQIFHI